MSAPAALERLLALERFERSGMRPGLERIRALLDVLGHPETGLRIVHVGGTNGKGSVSALTEAILRAAGLRTGLYTSPHLLAVAERIRVAGRPLAPTDLERHAGRLAPWLASGQATYFEGLTALALAAFEAAGVDAAVLEVGLGGRWDATTVGAPLVAVITRIDYDHQEFLGRRLEDIAAEKAAIIRGGVALSAAQAPEALAVVRARCREVGVPLWVEGEALRVTRLATDLDGHRLRIEGPDFAVDDLHLALAGLYQPENAALAVGAALAFGRAAGVAVPEAAVREGCRTVRWPGRFQVIRLAGVRPLLVLDGAHNPSGAAALAASLRYHFPRARLGLVIGISVDKDRAGMLKVLAPLARRLYLAAAAHPRAAAPADLGAALPPVEAEVRLAADAADGLAAALGAPDLDVVCVAGSLFLVADALRWLTASGHAAPA